MIYEFGDTEKRLVTGAVLIPNRADSDGDVVDEAEIERLWVDFNENYQNIDLEHSFNNVGTVIGSHLLEEDKQVEVLGQLIELPRGTWIMTVKVLDDRTWSDVKAGKIRGFSVTAVADKTGDTYNLFDLVSKSKSGERITFKDLGKIKVVTVSLVANPAVGDALFYSVKSAKVSLKDKLNNLLIGFKSILETDFELYDDITEVDEEEVYDMDREEILTLIAEAIDTKVAEFETRLLTAEEALLELAKEVEEVVDEVVEDDVIEEDLAEKAEDTEEVKEEDEDLVAMKSALVQIAEELKGLKGLVTSTKSKGSDADTAGAGEQSLKSLLGL